jgi:hypothetical protein
MNLNQFLNFKKKIPFKVVELDKNIGCAIISNQLYNGFTLWNILMTLLLYKRIDSNPLESAISNVNESLSNLLKQSYSWRIISNT